MQTYQNQRSNDYLTIFNANKLFSRTGETYQVYANDETKALNSQSLTPEANDKFNFWPSLNNTRSHYKMVQIILFPKDRNTPKRGVHMTSFSKQSPHQTEY